MLPVNGINTGSEPMVIRKGQRLAVATELHADTVALVTQQDAKQCDDGTTTKGMITTTEHNDGDHRRTIREPPPGHTRIYERIQWGS